MILEQKHDEGEVEPDSLGGRIVRARAAEGLSTAQLARRTGVLTETLQAWESDRLIPRTNQLIRIAGILNVSPTWLLHERGESPGDENVETEIARLQENLSRLRGMLLSVVEGMERIERRLEQYESYN